MASWESKLRFPDRGWHLLHFDQRAWQVFSDSLLLKGETEKKKRMKLDTNSTSKMSPYLGVQPCKTTVVSRIVALEGLVFQSNLGE